MPMNDKSTSQHDNNDWWQSFHVIEMADLFLDRPQIQVDQTTDFLMEAMDLKQGDLVFDQCCGVGTLALNLARRNLRATGVDLCQIYIDRAIATNGEENLACEFFCDDGFTFVPAETCDGAFECLKPGGFYALDIPNLPNLLRGFQHHLVRTGQSARRDVTCMRHSNINLEKGLLEQTWEWFVEGQAVDRRKSALRLYLPHQVREMLQRVGFDTIQQLGGTDSQPLSIDSPRLILIARKPL